MKKGLIIGVVFAAMLSMLVFAGCADDRDTQQQASDKVTQKLTLNERYVWYEHTSASADEQRYIMFKEDNKGEYVYYGIYTLVEPTAIYNYKINFKYLIIEDTVLCFYDSVTFFPNHNQTRNIASTWSITLGFSENILMTTSASCYICVNYLPSIPNFGK